MMEHKMLMARHSIADPSNRTILKAIIKDELVGIQMILKGLH